MGIVCLLITRIMISDPALELLVPDLDVEDLALVRSRCSCLGLSAIAAIGRIIAPARAMLTSAIIRFFMFLPPISMYSAIPLIY